jgi:hypothetical protein
MPRNDTSDSLSVRAADDPRRPLKALAQEAEKELLQVESTRSGGSDHRAPDEEDAERRAREEETDEERARVTREQDRGVERLATPDGDASSGGGGNATRGPTRGE